MVNVRSSSESTNRWENNAGDRQNYESGVENPINSYQDGVQGAGERYNDAVRAAADRGAYADAVGELDESDWQDKALELGASRLASGVSANTDKYEEKVQPYLDRIASTDLPARGPSGDVDTNIERARVMAQALRDEKTGN